MTATTSIPDGTYVIYPDGSGWIAYRLGAGNIVGYQEEWQQSQSDSAGDSWAGFDPETAKIEQISESLHDRLCSELGLNADAVIIERVKD